MVILTGNVTASAMGKNSPGFALGTDIFIAAGTAIYEALAARMANINLLPISSVTSELIIAITEPLIIGITIAKIAGNQPKEKKAFSFLPLVMPMSNKNIARNPLNRSFVKGLIPSACFALARYPIIRLPIISKTLPFVNECLIAVRFFIISLSSLLQIEMSSSPIIIAGDSINAIMATM